MARKQYEDELISLRDMFDTRVQDAESRESGYDWMHYVFYSILLSITFNPDFLVLRSARLGCERR